MTTVIRNASLGLLILAAACTGETRGGDAPPSMADAGAMPPGTEPDPVDTDCADPIAAEVIALANAARADQGAGALRCDANMMRAALLHSDDMCTQDYFSHTSLDGTAFDERMRREGVTLRTGGENIAAGQRTPSRVHDAWMNSDGHRRNILNGGYGRIGVGYVACDGRHVWTQVFAN